MAKNSQVPALAENLPALDGETESSRSWPMASYSGEITAVIRQAELG